MFTTFQNSQLPQFMSQNALSQPLLNKICQNVRVTQRGEIILIALGGCLKEVPTSGSVVCGSSMVPSLPPGPDVSTRSPLGQEVVPYARIKAHMQHFKQQDFQKRSLDSLEPQGDPRQTECKGKGAVVHDRIISDMLSYMDIERPRATWSYQNGIWVWSWRTCLSLLTSLIEDHTELIIFLIFILLH